MVCGGSAASRAEAPRGAPFVPGNAVAQPAARRCDSAFSFKTVARVLFTLDLHFFDCVRLARGGWPPTSGRRGGGYLEAAMVRIGTLLVDFERRDVGSDGRSLRIGARAFDILEVLYRAQGSVVSKGAIMDAVWPGLDVEENRLQVHIAALRKALGAGRDLIKTVPGRGYMLVAGASTVRGAAVAHPRADAAAGAASGQPALTPLVGREGDIRQIVAAIDRAPVVTLAGAGGIGKTSLALHVAHVFKIQAHERVHFVELANASTRDDVLRAVAHACGHVPGGVPSIDGIADAIGSSRCLLVLDNAEHVVDAVASLVETLAARPDRHRVLVTSREPLHISAESVFRVDPLAIPDTLASDEAIAACPAVELFLCRMHAAMPEREYDEASLRLIGEICRRLDGLPLAIELAAARAATLGVAGVAARLDERLELLTGGPRSALPRHQTLRATFNWSHALLDPAARALFRRLGCFVGAFTFDAVRAVAMEPHATLGELIAPLGELVAKSLLMIDLSGPHARYRLSESTRAYALEKLHNEGEFERIAARHARYEYERACTAVPGAGAEADAGPTANARVNGRATATPVTSPAGVLAG